MDEGARMVARPDREVNTAFEDIDLAARAVDLMSANERIRPALHNTIVAVGGAVIVIR